ncbi:MAG: YdcF family protein [Bacteriovoracaceae bacterium]
MLGRKYVFETKSTRFRRLFLSGVFIIILSAGVIISFISYIPIFAKMQKEKAAGAFFQKSPDAIAVFTGDKGRIGHALDLIQKNPSAKLFISGVYATNSFKTLVDKQVDIQNKLEVLESLNVQVDLDYESRNTFENVRETVQFLAQNKQFNKVLIISSDYHILRISMIFSHFITTSKPEFYYDSVINTYSTWDDVRKLLKESVKYVRALFLLKVMDRDYVQEEDY